MQEGKEGKNGEAPFPRTTYVTVLTSAPHRPWHPRLGVALVSLFARAKISGAIVGVVAVGIVAAARTFGFWTGQASRWKKKKEKEKLSKSIKVKSRAN